MPNTQLDLLRHGQCEGGEIFRGSHDVALTPEGWQNMEAQLKLFDTPPWHRVISSPLQRCRTFAESAAARWSLPLLIEPGVQEMHFGAWEGQEYAHLWETDPRLRAWGEDPELNTPPDGEPLREFAERVDRALKRLVRDYSGERLLVITHGGVIRLLLTQAHGIPRNRIREMEAPYAHFVSLSWNSHLGALTPTEAGDEAQP
ncbi:histidine phosphatase family protein [Marinimicrobium sp. ABcell2]|uniref:histidine phosphatase family protein n=1 Tax=Marinimicrobium sp. ABcell2 TaxID=3069751 RepID=UPI0027B33529|nr:alpha-ribazole phosphatase family protein [Marinimicrobium sp. ABcell2]MDQ2076735.1 alpha-ribazole phosphatase family protein [Marinimicrobium sp. ABcell2]